MVELGAGSTVTPRNQSTRRAASTASDDVLREIDVTIERGELCAVLGPSGSGKSTLLHVIGALVRPTQGSVVVDGVELTTAGDDELARLRRERIGFVFQAFNLVPVLSVEEIVALPAQLAGVRPSAFRPRVERLLDEVGLAGLHRRRPAELSGGEQQRTAIARALVMQPSILLADEPTGNLDSDTGRRILDLFGRLHDEGQTLVVVTHDATVAKIAQRVLHLRDGRIARSSRLAGHGPDAATLVHRAVDAGLDAGLNDGRAAEGA